MNGIKLPEQYRFGMVGLGQNRIVENYLTVHKKSRFLHVGLSSSLELNRNVASLVNRVTCGDLHLVAKNLKAHNIPNMDVLLWMLLTCLL